MPVAELCRLFLEERSGTVLRPRNNNKTKSSCSNRIFFPNAGDVPLGKVDRNVLQRVIQRMIDRGLA